MVDTLGGTVARLDILRAKVEAAKFEGDTIFSEIERAIEKISGSRCAEKRAVLELRYLDMAGWDSVNYAIFGGKTDFLYREDSYLRRIFYIHADALKKLSVILDDQRAAGATTKSDGRN